MAKDTPPFIVNNVSYKLSTGVWLFRNVSFSIGKEKLGLIGKNGMGKTTLVRMMLGEVKPTEGSIEHHATIAYLPQDYHLNLEDTIEEALGAKEKLAALSALKDGDNCEEHKAVVGSDWDLEDRIKTAFETVNLSGKSLKRTLGTLSGGERTKVVLARLLVSNPDYLVLDEPTNNLDITAKELVYDLVRKWEGGLLVISHDRTLLNLMDRISELRLDLDEKVFASYGGNYDFYKEQRDLELGAAQRRLTNAKETHEKAVRTEKTVIDRQEKRNLRGKEKAKEGGIPRIVAGKLKQKAQKTTNKLKKVHRDIVLNTREALLAARAALPEKNRIIVNLRNTEVPTGKLMVMLENVTFGYEGEKPLFNDLSLSIHGPERIAITGSNGVGKTTLVKLMTGNLTPQKGEAYCGTDRISYLDQHIKLFDNERTLLGNFSERFPIDPEKHAPNWLSRWLFRDKQMLKYPDVLSGGERMRAGLSYILAGEKPPHLLILDEPVNNLDIETTEQLESALLNYQGTLIVISHDKEFLSNIGITREVKLPL